MSAPTPEDMAEWPPPNYIDPETRVTETLITLIAGMTLMLVFVAGRIFSRAKIRAGFQADDWIILTGVITVVGTSILGCVQTRYGSGHHLYDIKPEWVEPYGKMALANTTLFNACVTFPKLSLCFTYLRLFPSRANRVFCHCLIVFLIGWVISTCLVTVLQCLPVRAYWDQTVVDKKCINTSAFSVAAAALNSATDFLVFWWPVRSLWRIQLPVRQRLGLVFVFAVGSIVCVAGIVRMYYIHELFLGYEYYYDGAIIMMAASIESNIGIIFACLHSIKPILAEIFPNIFGSSQSPSYRVSFSERSKMFLKPGVSHKDFEFREIPADSTTALNTANLVPLKENVPHIFGSSPGVVGGEAIELPEKAVQHTRRVSSPREPVRTIRR